MSPFDNPSPDNLLNHYITGSVDPTGTINPTDGRQMGYPQNLDINQLDSSAWDITQAPGFHSALEKAKQSAPNPVFVSFPNTNIAPKLYQPDFYGIGQYNLNFNGLMSVAPQYNQWKFDGDAHATKKNRYDFDPQPWGKRSYWGEATTRVGHKLPGHPYDMYVNGFRRHQQTGHF